MSPTRALALRVAVLWGAWLALYLAAPALFAGWVRSEGPAEWVELALIAVALAEVLRIAWGLRTRRPFWPLLACGILVAQLLLLAGEELDWGRVLGFDHEGQRNLRMAARVAGWRMLEGPLIVAALPALLLAPLLPEAVRTPLKQRLDPVFARSIDGVSTLLVLVLIAGALLVPDVVTTSAIQLWAYLSLVVALRRMGRPEAPEARPQS